MIQFPFPLTIGIRDSGAGGLTVARQIRALLPQLPIMYFADTAHVPYGDRDPVEIRHFAFSITDFLREHGADIVIFACNTTSAYALAPAREHFDIPLLGMIEGGAEAALEAIPRHVIKPRIAILATNATVKSHAYSREILSQYPEASCIEIACPHFVPLVESGKIHSDEAVYVCREALRPLLHEKVDAIVLGCTHFPLLLPALRKVAPQMTFVNPAIGVARQTARLIKSTFGREINNGAAVSFTDKSLGDRYFASGPTEMLQHWIMTLMQPSAPPQIYPGPVFSLESASV